MRENWNYYRGDIYLVDLATGIGSEQGGCRPVLVIQNNTGNRYGPTLIVAPISSRYQKKRHQPTHCILCDLEKLRTPSLVLAEQITTVDKSRVMKYLGRVPEEKMEPVNTAIRVSLALTAPETPAAPCMEKEFYGNTKSTKEGVL